MSLSRDAMQIARELERLDSMLQEAEGNDKLFVHHYEPLNTATRIQHVRTPARLIAEITSSTNMHQLIWILYSKQELFKRLQEEIHEAQNRYSKLLCDALGIEHDKS